MAKKEKKDEVAVEVKETPVAIPETPVVEKPGTIGGLENALNKSEAKAAACLKFITDLVNDPFALTPMAKVRAQEFLARI